MADNENPYAAPQAAALSRPVSAEPGNARLRTSPAQVPAGRGAEWVSLSWQMFRKAPGVLVAMMLLYFVLAILAGMIPVIGDLFMSLAFGLWMAGWAITMDKLHRGADVSVGDLFAGFSSPRAGSLFAIGAIYLGLFLVSVVFVGVLAVVLLGVTSFEALSSLDLTGMALSIAFLVTLFLLLLFLLFAYVAYAPMLVALHGVPVFEACGMSLRAMLRNWLPMTLYGLIITGLLLLSVFTLFLGLLVLFPMMVATGYVSYREIFLEE